MYKKLFILIAISLLICSVSYAAVGYKDTGAAAGAVTDLNVYGGVQSFDGSTLTVSMIGTARGGVSAMVSGSLAIPIAYDYITKAIGGGAGAVHTLADGTPGQVITILAISVSGSGTAVITPTTTTGFTTVTLDAAFEYVTFLYVDDTVGWVIVATNATIA